MGLRVVFSERFHLLLLLFYSNMVKIGLLAPYRISLVDSTCAFSAYCFVSTTSVGGSILCLFYLFFFFSPLSAKRSKN